MPFARTARKTVAAARGRSYRLRGTGRGCVNAIADSRVATLLGHAAGTCVTLTGGRSA